MKVKSSNRVDRLDARLILVGIEATPNDSPITQVRWTVDLEGALDPNGLRVDRKRRVSPPSTNIAEVVSEESSDDDTEDPEPALNALAYRGRS